MNLSYLQYYFLFPFFRGESVPYGIFQKGLKDQRGDLDRLRVDVRSYVYFEIDLLVETDIFDIHVQFDGFQFLFQGVFLNRRGLQDAADELGEFIQVDDCIYLFFVDDVMLNRIQGIE